MTAEIEPEVRAAMDSSGNADKTTIGRRTGDPRRIEIYSRQFERSTTSPVVMGPTGLGGNIVASPHHTTHLRRGPGSRSRGRRAGA